MAAWRVLQRLEGRGARLDESLSGLPELEALDLRDRALANELVTGTIKRRASLDAVLGAFTKAPLDATSPDVLAALRLTAFQLLFLDRVPAHAAVDDAVSLLAAKGPRAQGFANAVLRKVASRGRPTFAGLSEGSDARSWSVRHSCPRWLARLLRDELGDATAERFLVAANAAPERCLRVNTGRANLEEAEAALAAAGFTTTRVDGLPEALLYDGPALERSAPFRAGLITPQSRGSQLAGLVVDAAATSRLEPAAGSPGPGTDDSTPLRVLDLCAAPGTKTSQLAASLPGAFITAVELDPGRLVELRRNLQRLGVTEVPGAATDEGRPAKAGVELVAGDVLELPAAFDDAFDAVLLDAPCSGLGTLASRADLRWRRHVGDVPRLAELQRRLLARAAHCVRPGGTLTYAVCTLPRTETVDVVVSLLEGAVHPSDAAAKGSGAASGISAASCGEWRLDDLGAAWPALAHPDMPAALRVVPPDFGSTGFFIARLRRRT